MQNYQPVMSDVRLEDNYYKALMVFFDVDYLFHKLYQIEFNEDSINAFHEELEEKFSNEKIRELINTEIGKIEAFHGNHFNYQFPAEANFYVYVNFAKNIGLLKTNQYVYIKHYIDDLVFILLSAITLTEVTGTGRPFFEQYLEGKKESFSNEIKGFAEDTTIKNVDNLTMVKSELMEYDGYIWQTMEDDKVRDSHRVLQGKHMQWDKPDPKEGHPGTAKNCRCVAIPKRRE